MFIDQLIPLQLTEHSNSSLSRQSAACSLGFTAIHLPVVHFHIVDPEGTVGEQLKTRVLEKKKNIYIFVKLNNVTKNKVDIR